ncbi:MAG: hypothetical protein KAS32_17005 [Candidatus Peribacteraceae bacterium]|nr:hypothetical protein [Candidatus Peribacteraceae bacterium]
MDTKSKFRGYEIEWVDGEWYFCDTDKLVEETHADRPCGYCRKEDTKEGHDGCLSVLPGLMNACCGHGVDSEAYVQFLDGTIIGGDSARIIITELKAL